MIIGFLAKAAIGAAAAYGITKLLEEKQVVEKVAAWGTQAIDKAITFAHENGLLGTSLEDQTPDQPAPAPASARFGGSWPEPFDTSAGVR